MTAYRNSADEVSDTFQSVGVIAATLVNRWAWWQKALANPSLIGTKELPVHESEPQQGYYRTRFKGQPWEPVAIFYPEGSNEIVAYRNGREVRVDEIWTWCCRYPVTYEAYQAAVEGEGWPDDDKTVAAQVKPREAVPGDNSGAAEPTETIKDQIDAALARSNAYEVISDDETAAKALSLRNRLNELSREADKIRTKEKEPHLEAGRAVDAKWQPLVRKAKTGADQARDAIGAWETKKLQEQRRREREAEEARIAAEMAAREQQADTAVLEAPAPVTAPVEVATTPIKPTYGKTASVQVKTVVKDVTDWSALAVYMSIHPEMQDLLRKLAQRALDAGRTGIPGITTTEEAKVR
ncbi:hypothetical protein [Phyllobacterium leguminum]|uniref:Uncharacterized protein n=1 Tax=Phyllobacterium leguminum TaxID=314237 RepID=A0A318T9T1_9HYPH|nr:hypothetical protein [Phyllobacterium leguminum]PYE89639.1 hypothetical protein C7477_103147 [Phyllobacterium leguminum]